MISLIQSYYNFLHLGMYLDYLLRKGKIPEINTTLKIKTGKNTFFKINNDIVNELIKKIKNKPNLPNIYAYIVQFSAFKGIFTTTIETLSIDKNFDNLFKQILKDQYFDFIQLLKFIRNVIVHSNSLDITLKNEDFEKQREFLKSLGKTNILLNIKYGKILPNVWKGDPKYGFNIKLDFTKIKEGDKLLNIIGLHNLYLICEFIYNITKIYEKIGNSSK